MPNYIHPSDLIDLTDDQLQSKLDDEQKIIDSFDGERGQKPPEFWTHVANKNVIFQVLERRKNRRNG